MTDTKSLRELAERATPGPWEADTAGQNRIDLCNNVLLNASGRSICDSLNAELVCVRPEYDENGVSYFDDGTLATFKYIAAANPAAIIALLDENAALTKERDATKRELTLIRNKQRRHRR